MSKEEKFIKIPIGIYRDLMLELSDAAFKEQEHAKASMRKIEERKALIRKYNKDVFKDGT